MMPNPKRLQIDTAMKNRHNERLVVTDAPPGITNVIARINDDLTWESNTCTHTYFGVSD